MPRGGGGYPDFFLLQRLVPAFALYPQKIPGLTCHPNKNIKDFMHTQKILEILEKPKKCSWYVPCPLCLMVVVVCIRVNFITEHK